MFTKTNPAGWSFGSKLTSQQANDIDGKTAQALDKSPAGDTLTGVVGFSGAGQINANQTASILSTVTHGIQTSGVGGIESLIQGGIALSGGGNDEITYTVPRTKNRRFPMGMVLGQFPTAGWTSVNATPAASYLQSISTTLGGGIVLGPLRLHHGASLVSIRIYVKVAGPHTGGLPAQLPIVSVYKQDASLNALADVLVASGSPNPVNAAAWDATTFWDVPCPTTVDNTTFYYTLFLQDEFGANSVVNNRYLGIRVTQNAIGSMAFE